jgi:flagellar biosynthesis protein FlhG
MARAAGGGAPQGAGPLGRGRFPQADAGTGGEPAVRPAPAPKPPHIVAIGGGKGGIGKSLVAVTLGIELVRRGLRVVLVDCDLGGANLHSFLGMDYPRETLSDFVLRRVETISQLVISTPVPGLGLISGARNAIQVANPLHQQKLRLLRALGRLDADVVVLDLGAGTHFNVVDFFLQAQNGILVIVPEPTSVENAYRFLKAAFLRRVRNVDAAFGIADLIQEVTRARGQRPLVPAELVREVGERDPEAGAALAREMASFRPLLLVNQVREPKDLALGEGMCEASRRLFGLDLGYLGHLRHYDQVWRAVRSHQAVFFERLGKSFALDLAAVAGRLLELAPRAETRA